MLCENCQEKVASVHVAVVSWPAGEDYQHLCESCYPEAEAARLKPYAAQPVIRPPTDIESITAEAFLRLASRAAGNRADKPAFGHVCRELERLPAARARLGLQLLRKARELLEQGNDPCTLIGLGSSFVNSTKGPKAEEYMQLMERIIFRSVELLELSNSPPSAHRFGLGLILAVMALQRADRDHCDAVLARLKSSDSEVASRRAQILDYVGQRIAEAGQSINRRRRVKQ